MSKLKGDHLFSTYAKFSEKLTFLTPLLRICKWAYQVVRNLFFPRKFCVRTKWIPQVAFWILKQNVIRERVLKVVYTFLAGFDNYHKSSLKLLLFFLTDTLNFQGVLQNWLNWFQYLFLGGGLLVILIAWFFSHHS